MSVCLICIPLFNNQFLHSRLPVSLSVCLSVYHLSVLACIRLSVYLSPSCQFSYSHLPVSLSVHLSTICLSLHSYICLYECLSISHLSIVTLISACQSVRLYVCLPSVCPYIHTFAGWLMCPSVHQSTHISACPSISQSAHP
jgi:hypothetical protein